jgi:hypothetical protein
MTNSVAADGQTTLTGALKGYAGSVGAPGYSFASDSNCGFYRIGADNIGASCAGAKVLDISATGLGVTGTLTSSSTITATAAAIVAGTTVTSGTQFLAASGTASAPGYAFTGDTNVGMYRISDNILGLTVGSTLTVQVEIGAVTVTGALSCDTLTVNTSFGNAAAQADQETGTATGKLVTPSVQHFHPSASKCWLKCDHAGNVNASYNITSITDTGPGVVTVTIATDFSSAHYALNVSVGTAVGVCAPNSSQAAGSFVINAFNTGTGAAQDSILGYYAEAHGDL